MLHSFTRWLDIPAASSCCTSMNCRVLQELCDECAPAKELFDKASEILGYDLLAVCSEGAALITMDASDASCPCMSIPAPNSPSHHTAQHRNHATPRHSLQISIPPCTSTLVLRQVNAIIPRLQCSTGHL